MIDIDQITVSVITNGIGVGLMLILLFHIRVAAQHVYRDGKMLVALARLIILLCLIECGTFLVDGRTFPGARVISTVLNSALFILAIGFTVAWTVYVDYRLSSGAAQSRRRTMLVALPGAVLMLLGVLNLFLPIYFSISPDNIYQRAALFPLSYIGTYGYLVYALLLEMKARRSAQIYRFFPVSAFLLPVFVGSLVQLCFFGISLNWVTSALGLVSVYLSLQTETSSVDMLTGLYTRQYLHRYMAQLQEKAESERLVGGIMLDLDGFKRVNDELGHFAGDAALRDVGRILHRVVGAMDIAVRYGGDEFVIIRRDASERSLTALMDKLRSETDRFNRTKKRPYKIAFSAGYCLCDTRSGSVTTFFQKMDQRMYEEKRKKAAGQ